MISGAKDGDLGKAILKGNPKLIEETLEFYETHFPDHFYIELQRTSRAQEEEYLHSAVELAAARNLPVVATNEVVFLHEKRF